MTLTPAVKVPVAPSKLVITTFWLPAGAVIETEMFATNVVAFRVPYELTVIPVPLNDNVEVPAASKLLPVIVTV